MQRLRIFTGNANPALANSVASQLDIEIGRAKVDQFSDGEIHAAIEENVRGADCFILQSTCHPTNRNLMELLIMADALRRSSARRITAVIPYYGYARQDRQNAARVPITAKLVANLICKSGADRVMTMDLHALQICGFFDVPVDNLFAKPVLIEEIKTFFGPELENVTIVSPDAGGTERARAYAKRLGSPLAIIDKRRERANESEVMHIIGDVQGRHCVVVDDMIDTAGTLCKGVEALDNNGATGVVAAITHPVLSGDAYKNIGNCAPLSTILTTDTIPLRPSVNAKGRGKIQVATIAPLLAEAIRRTNNEESISSLFR
jgi:ribose-phosphate pyrophosphokinase